MASLTGQTIASSYEQLLHVDRDNGGNGTSAVEVKDGDNGTLFALQIATDHVVIDSPTASSSTEGGRLRLQCDDGDVMASGHRLGVIEFAGAETDGNVINVGARIEALCDATWSASENGADLVFYTTDGNASQSEGMRLGADRKLYFYDKGAEHISSNGTVLTLHAADTVTLTSSENSEGTLHWDGYNLRAHVADAHDCGTDTRQWDDVWATNSTIQTSDRNKKQDIQDSSLGLGFLNKLRPVEYKFLNKTRKHYGLIAQEVEQVLIDNDIATNDFAPFIKFNNPDTDRDEYGFRYGEMVGILIKAVQELSARVATLEG
tara:strand:+ start:72 stop:1028 length:957 start_codon:yes stop_codon:yes gene_type:complete